MYLSQRGNYKYTFVNTNMNYFYDTEKDGYKANIKTSQKHACQITRSVSQKPCAYGKVNASF